MQGKSIKPYSAMLRMVQVESVHQVGDQRLTRSSHLHLCDLAGSERQKATQAGGQTLREAAAINSTLHVLRRVVQARCEQANRAAKLSSRE